MYLNTQCVECLNLVENGTTKRSRASWLRRLLTCLLFSLAFRDRTQHTPSRLLSPTLSIRSCKTLYTTSSPTSPPVAFPVHRAHGPRAGDAHDPARRNDLQGWTRPRAARRRAAVAPGGNRGPGHRGGDGLMRGFGVQGGPGTRRSDPYGTTRTSVQARHALLA